MYPVCLLFHQLVRLFELDPQITEANETNDCVGGKLVRSFLGHTRSPMCVQFDVHSPTILYSAGYDSK